MEEYSPTQLGKIMNRENSTFQITGRAEKINYLHEKHFNLKQENSLYCSKKDVFNVLLNLLRDFISLALMSALFHSLGNMTDGKFSTERPISNRIISTL